MMDVQYMQRALELAFKSSGATRPNPMVGCVIVKGGKVVGEGWHKKCGGPHAEVFALRQAGSLARQAVMYLTLEPCSYQGRTPACVDQVIASGIKRVVVAMKDPNPRVSGCSIRKMRRAGIQVSVGCLKDEAMKINRSFCKWVQTGLPLVTVKTAQTLDGKIASASGHSQWITSAAARRYTHQLRNGFDAILVGINTVLQDDPELNPSGKRLERWTKVVLDSRLRIPLNARLFKRFRTVIATTEKAPAARIRKLKEQGVDVIMCPLKDGRVSLKGLLKVLGKQEFSHVLIEGGARLIGSALKEQAVDRMIMVVAPKILGDQDALGAIHGLNILDVNKAVRVNMDGIRQIGEDWIFEGDVIY